MIAIMFTGLTQRLIELADRTLDLEDGAPVFRAGAQVRAVFVVLEGRARLVRHQGDGAALVLQRARAGEILAEASLFAARYHCDASAEGPTRLARVPRSRVDALQREDPAWLQQLAARLAHEVQRTRARAELLSLKRVDARLDAWLDMNGGTMPERGGWVDLAQEIGVTPEALYRELARRR